MDLISIIVLTFNSEKTIIETLDSIRNQTYRNIEIIVSDDGSRDNTVLIVEQWLRKNVFVNGKILTSLKNQGTSANYNKALKATNGKLVKDIAGDDILYPNAIAEYYEAYLKDRNCIWVAKCKCFGEDRNFVEKTQNELNYGSFYNLSNRDQFKALCISNVITSPSVGLLEKSLLDKIGNCDESYPILEDYPLILKISQYGYLYKLIDQYLVGYRIEKKSVSRVGLSDYYKCKRFFFFRKRIWLLLITFSWLAFVKQFFFYSLSFFRR